MTEDEARADLEAKVREMFEPLLQVAINKLGTTPGVVQDHLQCGCDNVGLGAWVPAQERVPAVGTECVVLVRYSLDRPPFATVDRWDVQREDPTGMGGPTIETGEGWSDNFDCDVIAWIEIPPYPSVMIDQLIELLRKRAQASGGDALLEEAVDDLPKIQASSVSDAWVWIDFSGTKLDKGTE